VLQKKFVFLGDTTHHVFEQDPDILSYPVVIVECSFLYAEQMDLALSKGHICWEGGLEPFVKDNSDTLFVLIHFSLRYSLEEIDTYFKKLNLRNVTTWLSNPRVVDQMGGP